MTLCIGTRLGPYEILSPLGAGGMGEVYKAKDSRLDREVAIKVLPEHLSDNPELKARFEREARAISQLSHPHICALYDVGSHEGTEYLVMELLEGQILSERLERGALPSEQILRFGVEIADALDKAHRSGIIHRDLKPGNVMLTRSGVKLLDFGLAKTLPPGRGRPEGPGEGASSLPTEPSPSRPLTEQGTVLGTFQYMSPEQLEGKDADARTDIFAFGCVLYEMATGRRAFSGKSRASLIGAIMNTEPQPISSISPMTPPALDRVVRTCLAKDPGDRFQAAHDLKLQLQWIAEGGSQAGAPALVVSRQKTREKLAWGVSGVLALAAVLLTIGYIRRAPKSLGVLRATLDLPPGMRLDPINTSLELSPDGHRLAMVLSGSDRRRQLWVRPLDSLTAQPLAGTEGAMYPFWSPDGRSIGFFADGKLKKIDSAGGAIQTISDAPDGRGGSWGSEGVIVFAGGAYGRLARVSAAGGTPSAIGPEANSSSISHRLPSFLPDGRHLLFYTFSDKAEEKGVSILDLATGKSKLLFRGDTEARYVAPGYLVFVRENDLVAQPFDVEKLEPTGEAVPIAEDVQFHPLRATGDFSLAGAALLVFETGGGGGKSQLTWVDFDGKRLGTVGEPLDFTYDIRVAPDGNRAVVGVPGPDRLEHLWMIDFATGVRSRFTLDESNSAAPVWSPVGREIAYARPGPPSRIMLKESSGGAAPRVLFESPNGGLHPTDWSPDGRTILFAMQTPQTKSWDIWAMETTGAHQAHPLLASSANETDAKFSPDGKWIAYQSDETGGPELYVASYPGPGGRWQVTSSGVLGFDWLGPKEIGFAAPGPGGAHVVALEPTADGLEIGAIRQVPGGDEIVGVDRKNHRFIALDPIAEQTASSVHVVTNWAATLERK